MNPSELSAQLKKPTGDTGREVASALNDSNRGLYDLAFEMMPLKTGSHLMEIGFGNGNHFPEYFRIEQELSIAGVDFSADMCEEAKSRNPKLIKNEKLSIHCESTSSLTFPDHSFDLVVALNVIYFLDPPEIHLKEICRVLKPGGYFLIGYRPRHSIVHLEFTHQNFTLYEPHELRGLLEKNSLKIVREETKSNAKQSIDGIEFTVIDACLLVQKH